MAKYRVEYTEEYKPSPLSVWVHRPIDSKIWCDATHYEPELPNKIVNKGYPVCVIEHKRQELTFSSKEEIDHCISVFENKVLPTTHELANNSWMKGYQHLHWLSKWPGNIKSFKDRKAIIKLLNNVKNVNT